MSFKEKFKEAQEGKRFSYLFTAIIGLGFFTTAITWVLYNGYIPTYLGDYLETLWPSLQFPITIVSIIMVLDNIAAVFLQPWIGNMSDGVWRRYTRSKWGRRMPFLMVGIPLGAIFFTLLALFGSNGILGQTMAGFILLLVTIGGFNISMAIYRSPVVTLMPDIVDRKHRSRGNGLINLLGGIGSLIGMFIIPIIYDETSVFRTILAFAIVSIIMILCLIILIVSIKEPKELKDVEKTEKVKISKALKEVFTKENRSLIFILFAILAWFFGYNIVETFFTLYSVQVLNVNRSDAVMALGVLALTFIIFAFPAGVVAKKLGRKKSILLGIGLIVGSLGISAIFAILNLPALNVQANFFLFKDPVPYLVFLFMGSFLISGAGWAFININSIVIVWELVGKEKAGMGTGVYYFFSQLAAIIGPVTIGVLTDVISLSGGTWLGLRYIFLFSVICFLIAGILTFFVKKTGVETDSDATLSEEPLEAL